MSNLNSKQKEAFDATISGKNVFISGPGGTGKSYLVRHICDVFSENTVLLAPTGIAALNIGGQTIHSAFHFPHHMLTRRNQLNPNSKTTELFDKDGPVKRIVIDEISMVRGDVFCCIDQNLRRIRRINKPFGGLQLILSGDFYQLPPVLTNNERTAYFENYTSPFAFGDSTWSEGQFKHVELTEIIRQSDHQLITNLQQIRQRTNQVSQSIDWFNQLSNQNNLDKDDDPIYLSTTNKIADTVNQTHYAELDGKEHVFFAEKTADMKVYPAPYELKLKYGTKVMFVVNSDQAVNGEVGYVTGFPSKDLIEVTKDNANEDTVLVPKHTWIEKEYYIDGENLEERTKGKYCQFPLRYGWAVTIHKSQGLTLDQAIIDFGRGCFTSGQAYVALSRVKTPDGLKLARPIRNKDIIVDKTISEFYNNDCRGVGIF